MSKKQQKKVILAVGAHPDDIDFTSSGTIAKMIEEGAKAYYLVCTDGSKGSSDPEMTHVKLVRLRQREQKEAGKILGLQDVFFLHHADTQLACDLFLKEEIVRIIRTIRPTIVITWDPTFYYSIHSPWTEASFVNHTDHRLVGQATMDAVFPMARDRLTFPKHEKMGLSPHKVLELWLISLDKKGHLVDITKQIEKKLEAIAAHKSQFDDFPKVKARVVKRALTFAKEEEYEFAESFIRLIMP